MQGGANKKIADETVGDTVTTSTLDLPSGVSGESKFFGIAKADDGKLYCAPCSASVVLVIDPATGTTATLDLPSGVSGESKFSSIAKADDGKLYCAPANASVVLVIEGLPPPPSSLLPPPSASSTSALNDNALGIDRLGFVLYAKALVAVVKSAETPLSIGLYAQWGSGKTFFIGECLPAYRCIFTHHQSLFFSSPPLPPTYPPRSSNLTNERRIIIIRCYNTNTRRTRNLRHFQEAPGSVCAGGLRHPRPQAALSRGLRSTLAHRCRGA